VVGDVLGRKRACGGPAAEDAAVGVVVGVVAWALEQPEALAAEHVHDDSIVAVVGEARRLRHLHLVRLRGLHDVVHVRVRGGKRHEGVGLGTVHVDHKLQLELEEQAHVRRDAVVVAVRRLAQPLQLLALEELPARDVLARIQPQVVQLLGRVRETPADHNVHLVLTGVVGVCARERVVQAELGRDARRPGALVHRVLDHEVDHPGFGARVHALYLGNARKARKRGLLPLQAAHVVCQRRLARGHVLHDSHDVGVERGARSVLALALIYGCHVACFLRHGQHVGRVVPATGEDEPLQFALCVHVVVRQQHEPSVFGYLHRVGARIHFSLRHGMLGVSQVHTIH